MSKIEIRDNRQKDWFWLDNEYLNGYARHLGASCTVVYLSLCRHAHNETQTCFPSMKLIAEENGISTRTVIRAIKTLEEWGIINVIRSRKDDGTQDKNIYTLLSKSSWKDKPSDNKSHGDRVTISHEPSDKNDKNRVTPEPHNYTHINKTNVTKLTEFDVFWSIYPKKLQKVNARKKWEKIKPETQEKIIEHLKERVGKDRQWNQGYIPHPTTFLNGERWEDEYEVQEISSGITYLD